MANIAVFGLYSTGNQAGEALDEVRLQGFRSQNVSVLFAGSGATGEASRAPIGGALSWLVGIGSLAVPGAGLFIAAGAIAAALRGPGAGSIAGCLLRLGLPECEAKRYEGRVRAGSLLLSVQCDDPESARSVKELLEQTGARNISSAGEPSGDLAESGKPGRLAA